MGHAQEKTNRHETGLQMESSPQRTQGSTGAQGEFLGNLRTSSELADIKIVFYPFNTKRVAQQTDGFCTGLPSYASRSAIVYALPKGIRSEDTHVLKLTKNIYGQKQAGRVWNKYLDEGLSEIGFKPSKMDPCLYFRGRIALLVYINDCIMFGPDMVELDKVVKEMRTSSKKFRVEDLGDIKDFLGLQVTRGKDKTITLNQPQLIDSILKDMKFQSNTKEKDTPALSSVILQKDTQGKPFNNNFHYRRVIGKLNFLEKST